MGGPRRVYAASSSSSYTLLRLGADAARIMAMYWEAVHRHPTLLHHAFPRALQTWRGSRFLASFAVKMPDVRSTPGCPSHVERRLPARSYSPRILLKMGGYGFLRFSCRCSRKLRSTWRR